jgi:hypothetical protein
MKILVAFAVLAFMAFPVFSQDHKLPEYQMLSADMGSSISSSNNVLGNFDLRLLNNDQYVTFNVYKGKYSNLVIALGQSEDRLNRLIKANARESTLKEERENYERLIKRLQSVKSEFDSWLSNIQ